MQNNYSLFLLSDFSLKDFIDKVSKIKEEIINNFNFNFQIVEKEIEIFLKIIKNYGIKILNNLNYISKSKNLNFYSIDEMKNNDFKQYFKKQIILLFIFLQYNYKKKKCDDNYQLQKEFKILYNNLYIILIKYYSKIIRSNNNQILDTNDIVEIFYINIISSLKDLLKNHFIFNLSIIYLVKFFTENNNNIKDFEAFNLLFEQLYNNILINKNNLSFLKRDKNIENFSIFKLIKISCTDNKKLKSLIFKILDLIYNKNYSHLISNLILNNIKECFYELKKNYDKNKIIYCIKYLNAQTELIDNLFKNEEFEKDEYIPSTYFIFDGSKDSGINYNPNGELIKKSFTLVFSFKIEEIKINIIYPLITFVAESGGKDIIFNLSISNKKLYLFCQGDTKMNFIEDISNDISYLVVVEFFKSMINGKIKISLNGNKKELNTCNINYKSKSSLKIGYIPNELIINNNIFQKVSNFNGIIGPVIFFNNILDEKDFTSNINKLKGRYECILFINNNNNIVNYFYYEECKLYYDNEFNKAIEYFMKLSKKIDEECLFTICPLSMLNSKKKTNFFVEDIYIKNNKEKINNKELFQNFNTLQIYSQNSSATYAKKNRKSISIFVEYDGIYIYTLIIEYFYNLLRMLFQEPNEEKIEIVNEINNALCPIIDSITKIIFFFRIDLFSKELDTFGFSLKKLFNLLIDIKPLNNKLVDSLKNCIKNLLEYYKRMTIKKTENEILSFVTKLFTLICSSDYFDMSIYGNCINLFQFFGYIINNNDNFVNAEIMNGLLSFSFILNTISLDKHNNRAIGYTFKKNKEYTKMKEEYKNLLSTFIKQCDSFQLYIHFIEKVLKNNISILEKYKLIKIFYKNHDVLRIYDNHIKERKEIELNKSIFDIFKKDKINDKKNNNTEEALLNEYKKSLSKLINISPLVDSKNEESFELLKSLFILLIYEHYLLITFKSFNDKENLNVNNNEISSLSTTNLNLIKEKIFFFSNSAFENFKKNKSQNIFLSSSNSLLNLSPSSIKVEKNEGNENIVDELELDFSSEDNSGSFEIIENKGNNISNINIKEFYILDILLKSTNFSFLSIKALFACLCDQWNKTNKIKFIKSIDETYQSLEMCFGEFDQSKKGLFSQYIKLIECLTEENVLEKSLKLIFSFMKSSINMYKTNNNNNYSKSIFLHLFESKSILNNFFYFSINNEILTKKAFTDYIITSINNINNSVFSYHPRPDIFSFIKKSIKNGKSKITLIIKNICDFIIENIKIKKTLDKSLNNYLYFNSIRFIKTLINSFEKETKESQNLLINNNFLLFFTVQLLIKELNKNEIIYDPKIYIFNPFCFKESHKNNEKKDLKILQSQETKVLSHQIILLNLVELELISIFLIWTSEINKEVTEKYSTDFMSSLYEQISKNDHCISFYFDLLNEFFNYNKKVKDIPDNIKKLINKEIDDNYKHYINGNPPVRETRMITALLFLIILKYQSLLINYEKIKNSGEFNSRKSIVKNIFNKIISLVQNDILILSTNINKIKDDKKFEIIIEKEESKSKSFKEFYKNFYKYLIDIITKNKGFNIENLKEEIENKYIKEETEKYRILINFLKTVNTNENNNIFGRNSFKNKKDKIRKSSFGNYNITKDKENSKDLNLIKKTTKNFNKESNINLEILMKKRKIKNYLSLLDFENAKEPILCTKRDLVLTKFGHIYYEDYFKDNKFLKMKKLFLFNNRPENENNGFNSFQKLMKNKFPCSVKNFSNNLLFYPRLFYRPYNKFFENKYFSVSHNYFKENMNYQKNESKIFHLEYGHGLLNQPSFNLFRLSNDSYEDYSNIMDESINSNLSNNSGDKLENFNAINDEEFENNLQIYDNLIKNKAIRSVHFSNKNLPISMPIKEDNLTKRSNKRSKFHKKSAKQKLTLNPKNNTKFNIFTSTNKIDIQLKQNLFFECELISTKNSSHGILFLNRNFLIFQVDTKFNPKKYEEEEYYLISSSYMDLDLAEKQIIIPYTHISQILERKFLFHYIAIELFLYNGKSYFFNLYKEQKKKELIKEFKDKIKLRKLEKCEIIEDSFEYFNKNKYSNLWLEGKKTTLDYLLLINKFSNRSYNVLSQYLILPWILTNFKEIYKTESHRNMSLPMPAQTKKGLENITNSYNIQSNKEYKFHFPMIYSSSMYVNNYLVRIYPFTNNQIKCQGGKFEEPGRQFESIQDLCNLFEESNQATMELIPEFYFVPEMFLNLNFCYFGKINRNKKRMLINNINLGEGFKSILELITFHQSNINSDIFTSQINKWIDNIFGENQLTDKKNVINSFPRECYEKYVKEEINQKFNELEIQIQKIKNLRRSSSITVSTDYLNKNNILTNSDIRPASKRQIMNDIKSLINRTYFFGQCPSQLFNKSHPSYNKKQDSKIYTLSNLDQLQISLKNDCLKFNDKDLMFIKESSNGNYFFILSENQINVYTKSFKHMNNLSINSFCRIHPPFSFNYNSNIKNTLKTQNIYKYLIFEILDCKFFFVAGYLDNSFRIYSKEKDKNIMYSIYSESNVTCIRNVYGSNTFFTGHQNGRIIKWIYSLNNKDNLKKDANQMSIIVKKDNSIYGHQSFIKIIEINKNIEIIVSAGNDGIIFIRKLYDFELLSFITLNRNHKEIIEINLHKQIIILSVFNKKRKLFYIYTYSLNGIKLGKMSEQVKMPISIIPESDDIFLYGCFNMYLVKITMKEKISLISISNDLNPCYNDVEKIGDSEEDEENNNDSFNEDFSKNTPISYFYDLKNHVLFCLFSNGKLHRVNLIKNM